MPESTPDLTERLMVRAAHAAYMLQDHLRDTGQTMYAGRAIACSHQLDNLLRDRRAHQAQRKAALRRKAATRERPVQEYHCGR